MAVFVTNQVTTRLGARRQLLGGRGVSGDGAAVRWRWWRRGDGGWIATCAAQSGHTASTRGLCSKEEAAEGSGGGGGATAALERASRAVVKVVNRRGVLCRLRVRGVGR